MALSYVKVFVLKLNMLTQGLVHLMLRVFFLFIPIIRAIIQTENRYALQQLRKTTMSVNVNKS